MKIQDTRCYKFNFSTGQLLHAKTNLRRNTKFLHRRLAQLSRTQFTHSNAPNPHARKAATRNFRSSYRRSRPETNLHTALCWCLPGIGIWRVALSLLRVAHTTQPVRSCCALPTFFKLPLPPLHSRRHAKLLLRINFTKIWTANAFPTRIIAGHEAVNAMKQRCSKVKKPRWSKCGGWVLIPRAAWWEACCSLPFNCQPTVVPHPVPLLPTRRRQKNEYIHIYMYEFIE